MTTYVALLHSIVLTAGRRVVMRDLRAMAEDLGFTNVKTLVSTGNPFADGEGSQVVVRVMRRSLDLPVIETLEKRRNGTERLAVVDGDLWIDFGGKASETRLLSALTTKRLGAGTLRNWNTVRGVVELIGQ